MQSLIDALQKQVPVLMDQKSVPGLSLAIVENARVTWTTAFGVVDRESMRPVTEETVFEAHP
jgi:CubicO group peptidase (beta-lactamase class C family)